MNAALSATLAFYLVSSSTAWAQTASPPPPSTPAALGNTLTAPALGDLPSTDNVYSILDTSVPEVIADRIDTGGLSTGDPSRIGAHGSSWTQTVVHVGDVDITDPLGSGTPLLLPRANSWEDIDVTTGMMPIDQSAPGLAIRLTPRRAADRWARTAAVDASWPGLLAGQPDANPVPIARLHSWADGDLIVGGPIARSAGLFLTTSATSASRFERGSPDLISATALSSFAHLRLTPTPADAVGIVVWTELARVPAANRIAFAAPFTRDRHRGVHAQVAWNAVRSAWTWSMFSGGTAGDRSNNLGSSSTLTVERLRDGPVPELVNRGAASTWVWMAGANVSATTPRQQAMFGGDLSLRHASTRPGVSGAIYETIDGVPAHIWSFFSGSGGSPSWNSTNVSAFAGDRISLHRRLSVEAGFRLAHLAGTNTTGARVVSWTNAWPRAVGRWQLIDFAETTVFGGYARYGDQLLLNQLAWGDPASPVGTMSRWTTAGFGALIARVGPGTGGDPSFSTVDPSLRRPRLDEIVTGFDARPTDASFIRIAAIARRERNLIGVVDAGVPESAYTVSYIPDKGVDLMGGRDQLLPVYNRPLSTFGADRYLLTNPADDEATFVGADVLYTWRSDRLFLLMGATAGRSEGLSANRGFNANENDAAVIGEVFIDPNARTYAQGRLFAERGYTVKWSGTYRFPHDASAAVIARYQDGEHFARLVIVPDLDQGPEAIRAFRNGRTRFTYTLTLDVRIQKTLTVGGCAITAMIDGFNLLNKAKEVEEFPVTGPFSRLTDAVQPPRAVHLGARITF